MSTSTGEREFYDAYIFVKDNNRILRKELPELFVDEIYFNLILLSNCWKDNPKTIEDLFGLKKHHRPLHGPMGMGKSNDDKHLLVQELYGKWRLYLTTAMIYRFSLFTNNSRSLNSIQIFPDGHYHT